MSGTDRYRHPAVIFPFFSRQWADVSVSFACLRERVSLLCSGREGGRVGYLLWLLLSLLLAGCITRPPALPTPSLVMTKVSEVERLAFLHAHPNWSFTGRVALRQQGNGGSGRIEWQQQGSQYRIRLSAPVTRQSWQLSGDITTGHGRMDGIDGGPLEHPDAEALLLEMTGWDIPVQQLPQWIRGIGSDAELMEADVQPQRMQQYGWTITWQIWYPATETRPALPKRIEAVREVDDVDAVRIRLLVDRWEFP